MAKKIEKGDIEKPKEDVRIEEGRPTLNQALEKILSKKPTTKK